MCAHFVESLERRDFLSAAPQVHSHFHESAVAAVHMLPHRSNLRSGGVPAGLSGLFGGAYSIYPSSGNMDLTVTSARGRTFSGFIRFAGDDGASFAANLKGTMTRNNNFTVTIKGAGTSIAGTGTYYPDSTLNLQFFFNKGGRIDGQRMHKIIPGEAALIAGDDAFQYF